jgi:ActR/RegA family two-component response regulator
MVCDIFKKLGATCKAGTKTAACPQLAKKKRAAMKKAVADTAPLIAPDMPFNYDEVVQVTGREYVDHLVYDGTVQMPYEALKANMEKMMAAEAEAQETAPRRVAQATVHPSILVVDDEVAVNNNIRKILAKKGYQVDQAVTRDEAIERIGTKNYSLVLLDLRIPGVKGLELLKAIGDENPDAKVIIITGYASIETAVEAARMGAVDYLPKPFTPDEIRNATERAFQLAA